MKKNDKNKMQFPEYIIQNWEANDGINFAIALARITGWILHVDWWSPTDDKESVENMRPLRIYVGNNFNQIYDFRGKQTIQTFSNNIITSIATKRGINSGGVVTRCYSEIDLSNLPLRIKPSEAKIIEAQEFICKNTYFLNKIPLRVEPKVPANIAAKYTYGNCNPFAAALCDLKGYKPTALIAKEYSKLFGISKLGYVHSFVLDNENNAIDIWGKDSVENIAKRFELVKYELSTNEYDNANHEFKKKYPEKYHEIYEESVKLIMEYF